MSGARAELNGRKKKWRARNETSIHSKKKCTESSSRLFLSPSVLFVLRATEQNKCVTNSTSPAMDPLQPAKSSKRIASDSLKSDGSPSRAGLSRAHFFRRGFALDRTGFPPPFKPLFLAAARQSHLKFPSLPSPSPFFARGLPSNDGITAKRREKGFACKKRGASSSSSSAESINS